MLQHKLKFALLSIFFLTLHNLAAAKMSCYQCDSSNVDCLQDLSKVVPNDCSSDTDVCATEVDANGNVKRGCKAQADCKDPTCISCNDYNNCNNNKICKTCDSSAKADCLLELNSVLFNGVCKNQNNKCRMLITDGKLTRDCVAENEKCANADTCKICDGGICNKEVFPTNRLQCYQCENCQDVSGQQARPCRLYKSDEKCFTHADANKKMTRGCISEPNPELNKCSSTPLDANCITCTSGGCNKRTYEYTPELKCVQCSGDDCKEIQDASKATACPALLYNKDEKCYTQVKDNKVTRGCLQKDFANNIADCKWENNCTVCEGDACNRGTTDRFSCIRCRSDTTPDCYDKADTLSGTDCGTTVGQNDKKCFHGIWNDVVIRGCWSNANDQQKQSCGKKPNDNKCTVCNTENCNNAKTSGAASNVLNTAAIFATIAMITLSMWNPSK